MYKSAGINTFLHFCYVNHSRISLNLKIKKSIDKIMAESALLIFCGIIYNNEYGTWNTERKGENDVSRNCRNC